MENQHRQITGYRDLTQEEITAMNDIKAMGETVRALIDMVKSIPGVDQRCASIAATEMQTGFMWLTRSVARPTSF